MRSVEAGQPLGEVLNNRQRWLLVASLMVALFIGAIDQTVVSTATPHILADLGGFNLYSWLFTSYMLTSTIVVPLVGKLSDIFGRKSFILGGIVVFLASSIACGAAPNMPTLIVFRGIQGIGGGIIFASVFASVGDLFSPAERGKYMGMFTGVFSLASILGPTVGGFLTDNGGWRWVFYINVPFCLIALPALWLNLPARHGVRKPKIDYAGAVILSVAAVLLLLAFEWAGKQYDWSSPQIVGLFAGSALAIAAFIVQELRHPEPIIPLHLFRNNVFLLTNLIVFTLGIGMFGALQYLALFVQTALGASATASGIITTPQSLGLLVASIVGGQLIARRGRYRFQTVFGAVLILAAMLFLRTLDIETPRWQISGVMVVLGLGFGLVMPTMSLAVQNAVPYSYLGVASSSNQFFRQIGSVFGVALFAVILTNSYTSSFHDNLSEADASQLGAATVTRFEDPTLPLNTGQFAALKAQILAEHPANGQALIDAATAAQKESVASAVRDIFTGSTIVAALGIIMCVLLKEVPMRGSFRESGEAGVAQTPGEPRGAPGSAAGP